MPMTPELRRGIDRIRDYLFGGGYPNPSQNAEQLSFLIYFYMYEAADAARVRAAQRLGSHPYASVFEGEWSLRDPRNASASGAGTVPRSLLRWSSWADALNGERLVNWVREEVFPFHAELAANGVTDFMDGARLVIDEPTVLTQVVSQLNDLYLDRVDADTKGDLFEHVLRQIRQAGELGQFRTPRHVIRALVPLGRSPYRRDNLRSGGGDGGLLGRRLGPYPAGQFVALRDRGDRRGGQDRPARARRHAESRRREAVAGGDLLRRGRGPADGPPRHHEPDPARSRLCEDPAP